MLDQCGDHGNFPLDLYKCVAIRHLELSSTTADIVAVGMLSLLFVAHWSEIAFESNVIDQTAPKITRKNILAKPVQARQDDMQSFAFRVC